MQQEKSAKLAPFEKQPTIILSWWLFFERCQFGTFFLLHGFSKFLWLNNFFLSHLKYLPHILIEKVVLIEENPIFSITKTVNSSFLILPSTELDFFNYFIFLTFARIPGNQNQRLPVSIYLLFEIAIVIWQTTFLKSTLNFGIDFL